MLPLKSAFLLNSVVPYSSPVRGFQCYFMALKESPLLLIVIIGVLKCQEATKH